MCPRFPAFCHNGLCDKTEYSYCFVNCHALRIYLKNKKEGFFVWLLLAFDEAKKLPFPIFKMEATGIIPVFGCSPSPGETSLQVIWPPFSLDWNVWKNSQIITLWNWLSSVFVWHAVSLTQIMRLKKPTSFALIPIVSLGAVTRLTVNTIYAWSTISACVINTVIDICYPDEKRKKSLCI